MKSLNNILTKKNIKGFTLIELLIVMAILGILAGILLTNLQGMRSRARDARRKADLDAISKSLLLFSNNSGSFPQSSDFQIVGCGADYTTLSACPWGSTFAVGATTFMGRLPTDPSTSAGSTITYRYVGNSTSYIIVSELEIASDQDAVDSRARCQTLYDEYVSLITPELPPTNAYVVCSQ